MKNYLISPHVTWELVGDSENDDYIILNDETCDVIVVNNSAGLILNHVKNGLNINEIVNSLSESFDIDKHELNADVSEIIMLFVDNDIIIEANMLR